ncbi:hypothetical protein ACX0G9_01835 [Flavitalea flava]
MPKSDQPKTAIKTPSKATVKTMVKRDVFIGVRMGQVFALAKKFGSK